MDTLLPGHGLSAKEKREKRKIQRQWKGEIKEIEKRLEKERDSLNTNYDFQLPSLSTIREEISLHCNRGIINYIKLIKSTITSEILFDSSTITPNKTYPVSFVWEGFDVDMFESPKWIGTKIWVMTEENFERWVERGEPRYAIYDKMIENSFNLNPNQGCIYLTNSLWACTYDDYLNYYLMGKFWNFLEDNIYAQKMRFSQIYSEEVSWIFILSANKWRKTVPFLVTKYCTNPMDIFPIPILPFKEKDMLMVPIPKSLATFP